MDGGSFSLFLNPSAGPERKAAGEKIQNTYAAGVTNDACISLLQRPQGKGGCPAGTFFNNLRTNCPPRVYPSILENPFSMRAGLLLFDHSAASLWEGANNIKHSPWSCANGPSCMVIKWLWQSQKPCAVYILPDLFPLFIIYHSPLSVYLLRLKNR